MNAVEFLTAIWPKTGIYAIQHGPYPSNKPGNRPSYYKDHGSISKMASEAVRISNNGLSVGGKLYHPEMYVIIHSIKALQSRPSKDGLGTWEYVRRENQDMLAARCFFGDLDTAKPTDSHEVALAKYATQEMGLSELKRICAETGFPVPLTVNSGRGWHVYWLVEDDIDSETWVEIAKAFQAVMKYAGLKLDGEISTIPSHVLRIPGTWWRKDPVNPKLVRVEYVQERRQPNAEFIANVDRLKALLPQTQPGYEAIPHDAADKPAWKDVAKICPTFQAMLAASLKPDTPGKVWINVNAIALHTTGGAALAHKAASAYRHPDQKEYDPTETNTSLARLTENKVGPTSCGKLSELDCSLCAQCKVNPNAALSGTSPVAIARRQPKEPLPTDIPEPGFPYMLTKRGVEFQPPPIDGKPPAPQVILPYLFYPVSLLDEVSTETKSVIWIADIPHKGKIQIRIPMAAYGDERNLLGILANRGVVPEKRYVKKLGDYMSHYIRLLQRQQEDRVQFESFGWVPGYKAFIKGTEIITAQGTQPATIAPGMATLAASMTPKGTLEGQVALMKFYNDPAYVRQQFLVGSSLGAVFMFMTQHYGLIVNLTGDTGSAKSSALYAAISMWGFYPRYVIDGGSDGATALGRAGRVRMSANLPVGVDEITLMTQEDLRRMTMSITQAGDRVVIGKDGQEKLMPDTQKATVMLCTSNSSAHDQLSQNNLAGSAGSHRIFEIFCAMMGIHTKTQADAFLLGLREHYGHIGPEVVRYILQNTDLVRRELQALSAEVDRRGKVKPKERYWSTAIVVSIMGLIIAKRLGLLDYDPAFVLDWALQQLAIQREIVIETYSDPVEVLQAYLQSIANNMLVLNNGGGPTWNIQREPVGSLKGRLEPGVAAYISTSSFKEYCDVRKVPYDRTVKALVEAGVVKRDKMNLGRHVPEYTPSVIWCLKINIHHERMSGLPPIEDDKGKVIHAFPAKKVAPT